MLDFYYRVMWAEFQESDTLYELIRNSNTKLTGDITTDYSYGRTGVKYCDYYSERKQRMKKPIVIKNVIFNDPATIVFWSDGTKTIVKCGKHDTYDPEKVLLWRLLKGLLITRVIIITTLKNGCRSTKNE